ncbi:hypothetical protein L9F63_018802 [Diploptera punctata]|uniref:Peptidase M13 C-terminal domain-containing protein n=1 Tax=Diploptera punctata TaxID=6984 RepID=A0AAD7ZWN8_DIPPU|nr:hypothetical protein L9F63_018802 [Diploptera punctata]
MNYTIGYPDQLMDKDYLNSLYEEDSVVRGNYLQSVFNLYTAETRRALRELDQPTNELRIGSDILTSWKNFDKIGDRRDWWSVNTSADFVARSTCFVDQYSNYLEFEHKLNGRTYLGENIADNGGVRQSYMAYQKHKSRQGPEPKLPGLEQYTHEQLFFISFAHMYCSNYSEDLAKVMLSRDHSPDRYRVIGSLSNMEEFSQVWRCSKQSSMNPEKKCVLW